jgi:AcrR family transcriptional regulator
MRGSVDSRLAGGGHNYAWHSSVDGARSEQTVNESSAPAIPGCLDMTVDRHTITPQMRYPANHKSQSHERILDAAARLMFRRGVANTGIDAVMAAAGLTPGGFYAHFKSKAELVQDVLRQRLRNNRARLTRGLDGMTDIEWISAFVHRYLSRRHRDHPEDGCPIAALLSELAHGNDSTQPVLVDELADYTALLMSKLAPAANVTSRQRSLALIAMIVGGMCLARATKGSATSNEVLAACLAVATNPIL